MPSQLCEIWKHRKMIQNNPTLILCDIRIARGKHWKAFKFLLIYATTIKCTFNRFCLLPDLALPQRLTIRMENFLTKVKVLQQISLCKGQDQISLIHCPTRLMDLTGLDSSCFGRYLLKLTNHHINDLVKMWNNFSGSKKFLVQKRTWYFLDVPCLVSSL